MHRKAGKGMSVTPTYLSKGTDIVNDPLVSFLLFLLGWESDYSFFKSSMPPRSVSVVFSLYIHTPSWVQARINTNTNEVVITSHKKKNALSSEKNYLFCSLDEDANVSTLS